MEFWSYFATTIVGRIVSVDREVKSGDGFECSGRAEGSPEPIRSSSMDGPFMNRFGVL